MLQLRPKKGDNKQPTRRQPLDETARSRELILRVVLLFTLTWLVTASIILLFGILVRGRTFAWPWFIAVGVITAFVGALYYFAQRNLARAVSYILVALYLLMVIAAYFLWGIHNLQALLLAAFAVIISGILLNARYALYIAAFVLGLLLYINNTFDQSLVIDNEITNSNIIFLGILLGLIASVSWLFNDQMERSLRRAEKSEAALKRQKDKLEETVDKRTHELQAAQVEQLQQIYRFAELGILSTALLHDLANHLSSISVDIQGISGKSNAKILDRVKRTIGYIDNAVDKTRHQLEGNETIKRFSVNAAVNEVVELLAFKAKKAKVDLEIVTVERAAPAITGDVTRFKQLLTNLINNAIEAYEGHHKRREVIVSVAVNQSSILISVSDHGRGMSETQKAELFKPFYTTKNKGMGLGLFIAKEIAEISFGGTLKAASDESHGTVFALTIPLER